MLLFCVFMKTENRRQKLNSGQNQESNAKTNININLVKFPNFCKHTNAKFNGICVRNVDVSLSCNAGVFGGGARRGRGVVASARASVNRSRHVGFSKSYPPLWTHFLLSPNFLCFLNPRWRLYRLYKIIRLHCRITPRVNVHNY